jgi:hypothetical protein
MAMQDFDYRFSARKPKVEAEKATPPTADQMKGAPVQAAEPHYRAV